MRNYFKWLAALAGVVGMILLAIVLRKDRKTLPSIAGELDAIKAEKRAAKLVVQLEHAEALAEVERQHRSALEALDGEQRVEATKLRADPQALAGFLVRAARARAG